jgi:putative Holliday junction resolvase
MGRILSIDYGEKRVGIAVTDPLKIIANGLTTSPTKEIFNFLKDYCEKEDVECFVVGDPKNLNNEDSRMSGKVNAFIQKLKKLFPNIPVEKFDERFTSKMASQAMVQMGLKKKDRQKKELIDKISATIILQDYLEKSSR